jgi:regulator of protease activity HflC (stomatin/prohibitin superfamily)
MKKFYAWWVGINASVLLGTAAICPFTNSPLGWFGVAFLAIVAYNAISLKTIGPKKRAALVLFGRPIADIESGLALVPLLISYLEIFDKNFVQIELPGPPEKVWDEKKVEIIDGKPVLVPTEPPLDQREKWIKPIRVVFNDDDPKAEDDPVLEIIDDPEEDKSDPLRQRVITVLGFHYQIRVTHPSLFLQTFGRTEEAVQTISDMSTSELVTLLQKGTAARANSNMEVIARQATLNLAHSLLNMSGGFDFDDFPVLEPSTYTNGVAEPVAVKRERYSRFYIQQFNWLNEQLDKYIGMRILKIQMKSLGFGRDLAVSLQSVSVAAATSLAMERTAQAEKTQATLRGEGAAAANKAMKKALEIPGETVMGMQTLQGMDKSRMIIASGQSPLSEVIKAGLGLKEALADPKPPTT